MKARYICHHLTLTLYILLLMPTAHSVNIRLQEEGLTGNLQRNVRARLSTFSRDEVTADACFQKRVQVAVREVLRALGYYSPTITFTIKPAGNGSSDVLIVRINPGQPVKVAGINIIMRGDVQQDDDYKKWVKQCNPALGSVLNHGDYDNFKNGLSSLALRKGYFDATFRKSQLIVSPSRHQAYWDIDFDSGKRYHFGKIRFHGTQIRKDYMQNLTRMRAGDLYSVESLAELNRRLAATNWFNSIVISPDFATDKEIKALHLDAVVTPRTRNIIETSVGYATDIGPRVKNLWNKPWLNSSGHSLQTNISLSSPEQLIDLRYKIPLIKDPLEHYYLLQGGFKREDLNDTQSDSTTLNVARYWDMSNSWQRAINWRWNFEHFTQANIVYTTMLIYPGISINRTWQNSGLMPTKGDSQRYSVEVSNTVWGSDINFIILQAQNVWIRTLAEKHRFVTRGNLSWIKANDFTRIPPSMRFFAGGDRSIRGYKYKSLSTRDEDGKLTGSSKLITSSLEYQYNVTGKWWSAMFIDSGDAVNNIKKSNFKTGIGVGVRWQSSVGPIKFDIAAPITNGCEHGMQFYIGLGPEL